MDNELAVCGDASLASDVADILREDLQDGKEGIDFRPPRYTIEHRAMQFMYSADGSMHRTITGVIVLKQKVRGMWLEEEEGKEHERMPICSSFDGTEGIERPTNNIKQCSSCSFNQWESGKGKGKACKEMRRVLLIEDALTASPVIFTIPPTSLKIFDEYISGLLTKGIPPLALNTVFSLDKAESGGFKYAKLKIERGDALTQDQIRMVAKIKKEFKRKFDAVEVEKDDYQVE